MLNITGDVAGRLPHLTVTGTMDPASETGTIDSAPATSTVSPAAPFAYGTRPVFLAAAVI